MSVIKDFASRLLPAIPSLQGIKDKPTLEALSTVKTILDNRTSGPQAWLDRNRLQGKSGVLSDILTNGGQQDGNPLDFSTPPAPEGLTATGTFTNIFLRWNRIPYSNHAYTEIWRSENKDLGDAAMISTMGGVLYQDSVDDGRTYYYWIRFVSKANVVGPYNSATGIEG
jgi:hypothetical protein